VFPDSAVGSNLRARAPATVDRERNAGAIELARLIDNPRQARRIAEAAGIATRVVRWDDPPESVWHQILRAARRQDRLPQLLDRVGMELGDGFDQSRPPEAPRSDPLAETSWRLTEEEVHHYERQLAERSTLLPISFLQAGVAAARSVCMISYDTREPDGRPKRLTGTGFLIGPDELLTCHHVLPEPEVAARCVVEFNFEHDASGLEVRRERVALAPDKGFDTSGNDRYDWTIVRTASPAGEKYGFRTLEPVDLADILYVNIIGHPHGEAKQLSLYDNIVHKFDDGRILYTTETANGSSGSPVFDSEWRVVGLHNGWRSPLVISKFRRVIRNAGININRVLQRAR
jgi:hypothetical protein